MCLYSDYWIEWEKSNLAPFAALSSDPELIKRKYRSEECLFTWNDPSKDNAKLIKFLNDDIKIEWIENGKVVKDNNKTITITNKENKEKKIILKLDEAKKKVTLKIAGGKTHEYILRDEGGNQNIYSNILDSAGEKSRYLTPFQIDRARILSSSAFRRLQYKTQIFVTHQGDYYRTRLIHTLEVADIAHTIAKAFKLNTDLVEAISLGHDLGHTPFGHAGEEALNEVFKEDVFKINGANITVLGDKFYHNVQGVKIVSYLERGYAWDNRNGENRGKGLNLTFATREGILKHTERGLSDDTNTCVFDTYPLMKELIYKEPGTLESQVVAMADEIAQRVYDLEDAMISGLVKKEKVMEFIKKNFKINEDEMVEILRGYDSKNEDLFDSMEKEKLEQIKEYVREFDKIYQKLKTTGKIGEDTIAEVERTKKTYSIYKSICEGNAYIGIGDIVGVIRSLLVANVTEYSYHKIRNLMRNGKELEDIVTLSKGDIKTIKTDPLYSRYHSIYSVIVEKFFPIGAIEKGTVCNVIINVNKDKYLFSWNDVPKNNTEFIKFLKDGLKIEWTDNAEIKKSKNKETITVTNKNKNSESITLKLNKTEKKANLEYNGETYEYILKEENGRLNIYKSKSKTINIIPNEDKKKVCTDTDDYYIDWINTDKDIDNTKVVYLYYKKKNGEDYIKEKYNIKKFRLKINWHNAISLSPNMEKFDDSLKKFIKDNVHHSSRVARMNTKEKHFLIKMFKTFYEDPYQLQRNVWNRYEFNKKFFTNKVIDKVAKYLSSKLGMTKPMAKTEIEKRLNEFDNKTLDPSKIDNIMLGIIHFDPAFRQRIIEHISGMTDRFAKNEYNRLFMPTEYDQEEREEVYIIE